MKNYLITVNGKQYEVEVEELSNGVSAQLVSQPKVQPNPVPAVPKAAPKAEPKVQEEKKVVSVPEGAETVEAPMPGTILSIDVKEGDQVKAGQILVILEAMKMENEIVAPRDGKVAAILTNKGASVNTGDKLVSIE